MAEEVNTGGLRRFRVGKADRDLPLEKSIDNAYQLAEIRKAKERLKHYFLHVFLPYISQTSCQF